MAHFFQTNLSTWQTGLQSTLGEGGTHMLRRGMCRNFGSVFCKKSQNIDPHFLWKICKYGFDFQNFSRLSTANSGKFWKFDVFLWQNHNKWAPFFQKKSLNMGTYFWKKLPLNMGTWVLSYLQHTPNESKSEYPPGHQHGPQSAPDHTILTWIKLNIHVDHKV